MSAILSQDRKYDGLRTRIVLASSSAYRRDLLARLQVPFDVDAPEIDETPGAGESAVDTSIRLARKKAEVVAQRQRGALVIGSDQVAMLDGGQIGKPGAHDKALEQLLSMRGKTVVFHTALAVFDPRSDRWFERSVPTSVTFRSLPTESLEAYLRREQPYDCAGSAKSEGLGIALIERVETDDPTALVGLPLIALTECLLAAGYPLFSS